MWVHTSSCIICFAAAGTVSSFTSAKAQSISSPLDPGATLTISSGIIHFISNAGRAAVFTADSCRRGRGDCFPFFTSCFGSYGFVDRGRPTCVFRDFDTRTSQDQWASCWERELDRRTLRSPLEELRQAEEMLYWLFFPLIFLYILFYFSENQTIGSRCSVKHIEQIVLTSFPTAGIIRSGVLDFTRAQMSQLHLQAFAWSMCRWSRSQRNPETDESQGSSDLSQPVKISLLERRALAHQSSK